MGASLAGAGSGGPAAQPGAGHADCAVPARARGCVAGAANIRGGAAARRRGAARLSVLRSRGASFFGDLAPACGFDADQLRHAIGALVASGRAASDGFAGLRALVWAARGRPARHDRRSRFAGRWTAIEGGDDVARDEAVELQAWTLLRRYGVVFRRLLTRETNAASWRELARVYRRLEARGEIRSGRFVTGMSGEQFALPGGRRTAARGAANPGGRRARDDQRGRSAEPRRNRHRRRTDPDRQPHPDRLPGRCAARGRRTRRRAGAGADRRWSGRRGVARARRAPGAGGRRPLVGAARRQKLNEARTPAETGDAAHRAAGPFFS